ncbi:MAG: 16S rRNA (guanine(527)-N(7))-methyltransferase RsmG [Pseudotabrizicola sp.]|uniref:16S rRNA (guanine(527)-N(7))-methyltransferase RsmG n=1 Tax=Pseudotabrizicola sp. TaxID=2939647 RepID=UPI00271BA002|nr:16S rRNA (guanine(527)-N(7))-methyltransferase RsmG [Pseudotabrizicola sp.]MDO9639213.1 16S rRNA (guanine(527)-N(7))-methyltransferase RsmG [Pseudotabrizicola sp.]
MSREQDLLAASGVSRETMERFKLLESLIRKWNPVINLVSKGSISEIYARHIMDSVQLFDLVELREGVWCDMGSGGGFPGLVIAAMAKGAGRTYDLQMIESDSRKAVFLREAARQLDLHAVVVNARVEAVPPLSANVLSARALGPLSKLCEFAVRHIGDAGVSLFPKGINYADEIEKARVDWSFDLTVHPSKTEADAAILELRNIQHV